MCKKLLHSRPAWAIQQDLVEEGEDEEEGEKEKEEKEEEEEKNKAAANSGIPRELN